MRVPAARTLPTGRAPLALAAALAAARAAALASADTPRAAPAAPGGPPAGVDAAPAAVRAAPVRGAVAAAARPLGDLAAADHEVPALQEVVAPERAQRHHVVLEIEPLLDGAVGPPLHVRGDEQFRRELLPADVAPTDALRRDLQAAERALLSPRLRHARVVEGHQVPELRTEGLVRPGCRLLVEGRVPGRRAPAASGAIPTLGAWAFGRNGRAKARGQTRKDLRRALRVDQRRSGNTYVSE